MIEPVDFVVTCYEGTWRKVLAPGFVSGLAERQRWPFHRRLVLINNVDDLASAREAAEARREAGEIDLVVEVSERLDEALEITGLSLEDLGRVAHYSTWALVAVTLDGAPWMVHWDADADLVEPHDWVGPSIDRMQEDPSLLVANPAWSVEDAVAESETHGDGLAYGYGFSDQVFLVRRREFARPIYREQHIESWRYPLAHIAPTFECRIDAFMRNHQRYRLTSLTAEYRHHGPTGASYPHATRRERWRRRWQRYRLDRYRRTASR
ncbi:MAG: hypothetical protein AAF488_08520 [Planctomycetota bacterium]